MTGEGKQGRGGRERDLLGKAVEYTGAAGLKVTGTLVGIVDEPAYVIAQPWADSDLVVAKSKARDLREREYER